MNESLILIVNYDKICRLCLHATGAMSDIFESNGEISLKELVFNATGLKVVHDDGLPSRICHRCRYIVELSCELQDMVARTDQLLANANCHMVKECEVEEKENEKLPQNVGYVMDSSYKEMNLRENETMTRMTPDLGNKCEETKCVSIYNIKNDKEKYSEDKNGLIHAATDRTRKTAPKNLTCQICLDSFPTAEKVCLHVQTHYVKSGLTSYLKLKRPYQCEVCNRDMSKTQLIVHHRAHLNVNPFVCKETDCGFIGKNQDSLRHHMIRHGGCTQVCEQCGARFRRRWELAQHAARAHRARAARCALCRRACRNALTLRAHTLLHHRKPRYPCEWTGCTKAYHSPAALEAHVRTHSGDRVFTCHLCSVAKYTSRSLLNRHLRMHERARMSKCDKCSATFDDYGAFYRHRVHEHGPWQPYRCVGCNKGYQSEEKLEKHSQMCEQAIRMKNFNGPAPGLEEKTEQLITTSMESGTELLEKLKEQSLLVQPGNISTLAKDLVLQEIPPGGLLYIEVDSEAEERANEWH